MKILPIEKLYHKRYQKLFFKWTLIEKLLKRLLRRLVVKLSIGNIVIERPRLESQFDCAGAGD